MRTMWMMGLVLLAGCSRPAEAPRAGQPTAVTTGAAPTAEPRRAEPVLTAPVPLGVAYPASPTAIYPAAAMAHLGERYRVVIQRGDEVLMDWTQTVPGDYSQTTGRDVLSTCEGKTVHVSAVSQVRVELSPNGFEARLELDPLHPTCATTGSGSPSRLHLEATSPLPVKVGDHQTWKSLPEAQPVTMTLTRVN